MSVGDVLDGAFGGLRAAFVPVAIVVTAVLGPLQLALNLVLSRLAPGLVGGGFLSAFEQVDDPVAIGEPAVAVVGLLFSLVSALVTLLVSTACVSLLLQVDRGEPTDVARSLRDGLSVLGAAVGASLLMGLAGMVGTIAFVLVGVLIGIGIPVVGPVVGVLVFLPGFFVLGAAFVGAYSVVVPIAVIERRGPLVTLGRAVWVLRHRFWRLIGITLLVGLLAVIATLGLRLPFVLLGAIAGPAAWIVSSVGEILGQVVIVPVTAFAATLVYLDARVRHEGLDLQLRSGGIGRE